MAYSLGLSAFEKPSTAGGTDIVADLLRLRPSTCSVICFIASSCFPGFGTLLLESVSGDFPGSKRKARSCSLLLANVVMLPKAVLGCVHLVTDSLPHIFRY